ncbi:retrotransposon protein, putative, ty1-copia subclass [Tanacetum coccineum]
MDKLDYLEQSIPPTSVPAQVGQQVTLEALTPHAAWVKGSKEIARIILMTMEPEIQLDLENLSAYEMLQELKTLFAQQADQELLQTVQNYSMHGMRKTANELHAMRKLHEQTQPKQTAPALHVIRAGKVQKKKNKELVVQGLRSSRKLKPGSLSLYVGNGQREAVEVIGVFYLFLPSGLEIVLNNSNESSIYTVSNKRAKLNLDSTLLWHCRLGHISKKRIEKFQHDGLINSTDLRAFEKCIPCMSGKMARKPYTHQVERAKDLLGLIHTDHKHEVFETFKVFQKEVENQLVKTIKSLRSEFLDHLKDHGIIVHHTPPYTPQHNGVSERRNRTLLDMVQSMMSQTTLPKSFWDYALETVAHILYMVPTKKVEKTPY